MTLTRSYSLLAAPGKEAQLEEALGALAGALGKADGCKGTQILRNLDQPGHYRFMENWAGEASRTAAGRGVDKTIMDRLMSALAEPPGTENYDVMD